MLLNIPYLTIKNKLFRSKNTTLLVLDSTLYYIALHLKLSSSERATQLTEIFAYELTSSNLKNIELNTAPTSIIVYQFHNLFSQKRLNLFVTASRRSLTTTPSSLGDLFFSATWLEREVGEMYGICFKGKKDLRNLMLQYGDSSAPFRKSYPSIGLKETLYDSVTDTLVQVPVSIQA